MFERADHGADLPVQERERGGADFDHVAGARHIKPLQRAQRRIRLAFGGAEGREIVPPDQGLRRLVHRFGVEFSRDVPDIAARVCRRRAAVEDAVEVMAFRRGKARLEIRPDLFGFHDGHWELPQVRVKRVAQPVVALGLDERSVSFISASELQAALASDSPPTVIDLDKDT